MKELFRIVITLKSGKEKKLYCKDFTRTLGDEGELTGVSWNIGVLVDDSPFFINVKEISFIGIKRLGFLSRLMLKIFYKEVV